MGIKSFSTTQLMCVFRLNHLSLICSSCVDMADLPDFPKVVSLVLHCIELAWFLDL